MHENPKDNESTAVDLQRESIMPDTITMGYPPEPNSNTLNEWIKNLTENELANYDKLGYLLKLLRSICETPNAIALPGEEKSFPEKIPHREIIELMEEIIFHAKEFYGEEEKLNNWQIREQIKGFRTFFHALHEIKNRLGNTDGDMTYKRTLRDFLPEPFKYLVSNAATAETKEKKIRELQNTHHMSGEEITILVNALNNLKKYYEETRQGQHVSKEAIGNVLEELRKIEILRREIPNSSHKFGVREIKQIIDSIPSWIKLISDAVEDDHSDVQKKELLDSRAQALRMALQQIAPLVMKRHRGIIRKRLKGHDKIKTTVKEIEDKEMNTSICALLGQISKILSYLDFMWEMHEVTDDQHNKRIVCPQRMLRMTPLICREMEKLEATLNWMTEWLLSNKNEFSPRSIRPSQSDFPLATDMEEQSQPGFVVAGREMGLTIGDVADELCERVDDVFEPIKIVDSQGNKDKALAKKFEIMAGIIKDKLEEAKRYMQQTRYVTTELIRGYGDPHIAAKDEELGLSNHVQDFMLEVRSGLMLSIVELVNTFDKIQNKRKDVLPEYGEYEKQAANLRRQLDELKKGSEEAKQMMNGNEQDVLKVKSALIKVATVLKDFQDKQDTDIGEGKYYGIIKGQHYDIISRFVRTVKNFFFERQCDNLDKNTLALYALTIKMDQFANQILESSEEQDQNSAIKQWLIAYGELKEIELVIQKGHLNEEYRGDLEIAYKAKFMDLIRGIKDIKATYNPRFTRFLINEPLSQSVNEDDFNKEFFYFQEVMTQFHDFTNLIEMGANLVDGELLAQYDNNLIVNGVADVEELIGTLSTEAMNKCKDLARELKYTSPETANQLLLAIGYIKEYTGYMEHYNEGTEKDDFADAIALLQKVKTELKKQHG